MSNRVFVLYIYIYKALTEVPGEADAIPAATQAQRTVVTRVVTSRFFSSLKRKRNESVSQFRL